MILQKDYIRKVIAGYFKDKPVNKVWLFGSYARDEADDTSDIDVLVDIEKDAMIGLKYFSWRQELEELLSKKIDIVSEGWENKHVKPFIDRDKMVIYER